MKLIALEILKELYSKKTGYCTQKEKDSAKSRLKSAIEQLESLALKSDCIDCRYNKSQEELSVLNDEDYLRAFDKCRTCSNYYTNNYETKII